MTRKEKTLADSNDPGMAIIEVPVTPEERAALERAAAMCFQKVEVFVLAVALDEARRVLSSS